MFCSQFRGRKCQISSLAAKYFTQKLSHWQNYRDWGCLISLFYHISSLSSQAAIKVTCLDYVLEVDLFDISSTWRFLADISTPVTSIKCLQGPPRPPCSAVRSARRLPLQQRRLVATEQQPRSSLRACSELTAKKLWWLLWMSKTFSLTEINLELNLEINLELNQE